MEDAITMMANRNFHVNMLVGMGKAVLLNYLIWVNRIGGIVTAVLLSYLVFVDGGLNIFLAGLVLVFFFFRNVSMKLYLAVFVLFCFLFGIGGINFYLSVSMLGYFLFENFVSTAAVSVPVDIQNLIFSTVAGSFNDYLQSVARKVMFLECFVFLFSLVASSLKWEK